MPVDLPQIYCVFRDFYFPIDLLCHVTYYNVSASSCPLFHPDSRFLKAYDSFPFV